VTVDSGTLEADTTLTLDNAVIIDGNATLGGTNDIILDGTVSGTGSLT